MSINENTKPRALLLLRVSTVKQANGNDDCLLPVQQEKCVALCEQNGWEIIDTITETKSAYKNGMYERESIIDISNRTSNNEFDILVAFKLDRIGRKGNETTNFIISLLEKGIRVFTVVEGEITADSFEDEFMLTFRGLSAKQESRNISVRVKAALEILVQNGGYRGGPPMFGYHLVSTGETNRKGRLINILCVEENEAEHVREIFRLTAEEGKGTHQLAEYLNNKGIKTHNGAKFQPTGVLRILQNRIYIGHLDTKDIKGPYQEHLRIIDDDTFYKVQEILEQRSAKNAEKRTISLNTKGPTLLSGNVFCGHCGGRIMDGCYVAHQGKLSGKVTAWMFRKYKNTGKFPAIIHVMMKLMGLTKDDLGMMDSLYMKASDETINRNFMENYTYRTRPEIAENETKVYLWCGSKEPYALKSHKELKMYLKNYEEEIMDGYGHGEFLMKHTDECCKKIYETLK